MRDYCNMPNLFRAALLSAVVTPLSVGRIVHGSLLLRITLPQAVMACFCALTLVCAAVTAWGQKAGMPGIVTDRRTFLRGTGLALLLALAALPVFRYVLDPLLGGVLAASGNDAALEMNYPSTLAGQVALLCWMAGFQTLFVCAAPMSLFARLTGRRDFALALCMALGVYLVYLKVTDLGMQEHLLLFAIPSLLGCGFACFLFSRFGLAPTMILVAAMNLRLFLPPLSP
jgi:hypothetical protein